MIEKAREKFKEIKERLADKNNLLAIKEFKEALKRLIEEYDTSDWENRFVVGGVLEILFSALLNACGFKSKRLQEIRYDIEIDGIKFSIKSNFTGSGDIRLINILGSGEAVWKEPTFFFISEIGICYADPELELKTKKTKDALTINTQELKNFIEKNNEWLIKISIPRKIANPSQIKKASFAVCKSILEAINSQILKNYI